MFGPFAITESNNLPDGNPYAMVSIDNDTETVETICPEYLDGGKITVAPDETILSPGENFGIQSFGLNFLGDPADLDVTVLNDPEEKWRITIDSPASGPFGIFVYNGDTTGRYRKSPLELALCYHQEGLSVDDFYVPDTDGYIFSCHIADFTYTGTGACMEDDEPIGCEGVSSAFFALPVPPTVIELARFEAVPGNRQVLVRWSTASEIDNAGFNVYRAGVGQGDYVQINRGLIPARGTPAAGAEYELSDPNVENRTRYLYLLEDVDLSGATTLHGPVRATPRLIHGVGQ